MAKARSPQPHGNGSDIVVTMAHELAHGAFRLEHTFSEFTALTQGTTDNLMDYNNGTRLNKYQWDNIHNPVTVLGLFEEDEESSLTLYQTDGHYWTVYLVSLMIGIDEGISRILAYQAEYPDGVYTGNRYSERTMVSSFCRE